VTFRQAGFASLILPCIGLSLGLIAPDARGDEGLVDRAVVVPKRVARLTLGPSLSIYNDDVETTTATHAGLTFDYGWFERLQIGAYANAELTGARNFGNRSLGLLVPNIIIAPMREFGFRLDLGAGLRREGANETGPSLFAGIGIPTSITLCSWLAVDVGRPYAATPEYDLLAVDLGSSGYPVARIPLGVMVSPTSFSAIVLRGSFRNELAPFLVKHRYTTFGADGLLQLGHSNALVLSARFDGEVKRPVSRFDTEILWQVFL